MVEERYFQITALFKSDQLKSLDQTIEGIMELGHNAQRIIREWFQYPYEHFISKPSTKLPWRLRFDRFFSKKYRKVLNTTPSKSVGKRYLMLLEDGKMQGFTSLIVIAHAYFDEEMCSAHWKNEAVNTFDDYLNTMIKKNG